MPNRNFITPTLEATFLPVQGIPILILLLIMTLIDLYYHITMLISTT